MLLLLFACFSISTLLNHNLLGGEITLLQRIEQIILVHLKRLERYCGSQSDKAQNDHDCEEF
jgi:hypothetical protein